MNQITPTTKHWNLGLTIVFSLVVFMVFAVVQSIVFIMVALPKLNRIHPEGYDMTELLSNPESSELMAMQSDGDVLSWVAIVSGIVGILAIWGCVKMKRGSTLKEYLNLQWPGNKKVLLWVGIMLLVSTLLELLVSTSESFQTDFMIDVYQSTSFMPLLYLSVGIIGPIFEEFFFRGFLFKGIEQSKLGGIGAVIITTIIFVGIHLQYEWEILLLLLPTGALLGFARLYTKSLWVPIILHIVNNVASIVIAGYFTG